MSIILNTLRSPFQEECDKRVNKSYLDKKPVLLW